MSKPTKIEHVETLLWNRWLLIRIHCEDGTIGIGEGGVHGWQRPTKTMVEVIERVADRCFMPLTVGGGIRTVADMSVMLKAGADKTSINSSALANPDLIREGALGHELTTIANGD